MNSGEKYLDQLVDYIKKNLKKGYTLDSLRWALIGQGHSKIEVEKSIKAVEKELAKEAPVLKTKPEINYQVLEPSNAIIEEKRPLWKRILGM